MADETENKPKFILNKQKNEPQQHTSTEEKSNAPVNDVPEKKKVVVIKKKVVVTSQPVPSNTNNSQKEKPAVKVVTNTSPIKEQPAVVQSEPAEKPQIKSASPAGEENEIRHAPSAEEQKNRMEKRPAPVKGSYELSPPRPNIKQGNLAEKRRPQYPKRDGAPQGGQRPPRREGGFTGAQAREGYQNRSERDTRQGGQNGYQGNRGNYQNNQGGQGGYQGNRGGYQGGRPGYQGGQNGQGGQGGRPGYQGNRPGFQGGRPNGYGNSRPSGGGRPGGFGAGRTGGFNNGSQAPVAETKKVPAKKTFTKKKTVYSRKKHEEDFVEDKLYNQKKKQIAMASPVPTEIDIMETVSVSDLAKKMNLKASEIIAKLMSMGMMVSITQSIDAETATLLASEYNCEVHIISLYDETVIESEADIESDMQSRPPVVTIMGHVDHGKTKTLDAIRSSNVVATEFGGITQHIGAYMVDTPKGSITFLDTPGHEAFTMMRARGAKITDIVVLVVAADDGVMPQTIEAINHAKDAKVPIIVAVNKIDKPEANPDRVKTQLSELGLTPEDWGGETQYVAISALKKQGIDDLLEAILLQAEVLELKASWNCRAEGKVIESRVDHGRGVVSTVIIERGTLRTGDSYVAGVYAGRVRAIFNDRGQKINEATPSMPVEILGVESMPNAGDPFQVTDNEKTARAISAKRQELKRFEDAKNVKKVTLDNLYDTIDAGEVMELKVIIKADLQGSAEALKSSLEKLSTKDIRLVVIHSSAGAINESDVMLAAADSNAIIVGFNVRPTPKAKVLAEQEKVDIRKYNIIYKAVEEITAAMEGMLKPDVKEEVIGTVEVRDTFKVPKIGVIAGSYVLDGVIKRSSSVNIIRDGIVIHTGKISSLKRFKDDAKEVATGFECGIGIEDWHDINVGDQFEVFELVEVARKLGDKLVDIKKGNDAKTDNTEKSSKADSGESKE